MLLALCALTACSSFQIRSNHHDTKAEKHEVATLMDYEIDDGFIKISTIGHGCTFVNSFKVELVNKDDNSIRVINTQPDNCEMGNHNLLLQYSITHLDIDLEKSIKVDNIISNRYTSNNVTTAPK